MDDPRIGGVAADRMDGWAELSECDVRIEGDEVWEPVRTREIRPGVFLLEESSWWTSNPAGALVEGRKDPDGRLCIDRCLETSPLAAQRFVVRERALHLLEGPLTELMTRGGEWQHALGAVLMVHGRAETLAWFEGTIQPILAEVGRRPSRRRRGQRKMEVPSAANDEVVVAFPDRPSRSRRG